MEENKDKSDDEAMIVNIKSNMVTNQSSIN